MSTLAEDLRADLARAHQDNRELRATLACAEGERDAALTRLGAVREALRQWGHGEDCSAGEHESCDPDETGGDGCHQGLQPDQCRTRQATCECGVDGLRALVEHEPASDARTLGEAQATAERWRASAARKGLALGRLHHRLVECLRGRDAERAAHREDVRIAEGVAADRDAALAHAAELEAALRVARSDLERLRADGRVELRERAERAEEELATERAARVRAEAEVDGRGRDLAAAARERDALRAERDETLRRVRVVLDHFGVADCDDPIAALEEVPEIADAVVDDEVAHANELTLQIAALRAIVEGRTTPPTDAEIDAHEVAGGLWRWQNLPGDPAGPRWGHAFADEAMYFCRFPLRWWPLDATGRPCAWPVAAEPSR